MKKILVAGAVALTALSAHADVGAFLGVTYAFGSKDGVGVTLQATSSRDENQAVVAAGLAYYPFAPGKKIGVPVSVGYQWNDVLGLVSYDVLRNNVTASVGVTNTR